MGLSAVIWVLELINVTTSSDTYFLEKLYFIHSSTFTVFSSWCSSHSVCVKVHTADAKCKQRRRENVDWIFSDVGVLYMNKWNGLNNDVLKEFSRAYTMK